MSLKESFRGLVRNLSGFELEGLSPRSYALTRASQAHEAWYSYRSQLKAVLQRFKIDLLIDVGANEGQFVQSVRALYGGEVISFEPVSSVFAKLKSTAEFDPKWRVMNMALGESNSRQTIHVAEETVFSSLLPANQYCAERFGASSVGRREETITVRRLDEVLAELGPAYAGRRIFLKLDTQGYDLMVFRGLGERLADVQAMQSEVSLISIYEGMPHWTEGVAHYERAGFGVVGLFPVNRDDGCVVEYDCLLQRRTRPAGH